MVSHIFTPQTPLLKNLNDCTPTCFYSVVSAFLFFHWPIFHPPSDEKYALNYGSRTDYKKHSETKIPLTFLSVALMCQKKFAASAITL
jgi:hypothetical protein